MKTKTNIIYATLALFAFACFAFAPQARSTCQNGCGSDFNTFLGDDALLSNTTGSQNVAVGFQALFSNTTGSLNTAIGLNALAYNTTGENNTATGLQALLLNTTGSFNTATGVSALAFNTTGGANTATGVSALLNNTTGDFNTASGASALYSNTTGQRNTGIGTEALASNDTATDNTAVGTNALLSTVTGDHNTAIGSFALRLNTGQRNTATGANAMSDNTTGNFNTANGVAALGSNTTGSSNTAMGREALSGNTTGGNNTALGVGSLGDCNGTANIGLGFGAGQNLTTGDFNIDIGNAGVAGEARTIRIGDQSAQGATYIAGINGTTIPRGTGVLIDATTGRLGTKPSSQRFKDDIKPMDKASEAIHALKPVTFRYKKEFDPAGVPQFGLVAEDVAKVNPDLVVRDADGKIYTVRYDAVNAMLLNEFLKEHSKVEKLEAMIAKQRTDFEAALADLRGQIQKVSAQLELSKAAPQTVLNNH